MGHETYQQDLCVCQKPYICEFLTCIVKQTFYREVRCEGKESTCEKRPIKETYICENRPINEGCRCEKRHSSVVLRAGKVEGSQNMKRDL